LHDLKLPSGYSSNFNRLVSVKDMKMNFNLMKSHDCHVLMTALLPVALRGIKTELVYDTVTNLCLFFNELEQKVIDEEKLLDLERRHFETLCLLEATFPPEGPIRRTREGGNEWEPIKILLEGDGNSNNMNTTSNTRLQLTTQVGQAHVATGVPLNLVTNTQPSDSRTQRNTKPRVH
jgi:hypothetical protein